MKNSYLSIVLCAAALIFAPLATAADIPIEAGKEKGSISVASFNRIVKENPSQIAIVDVRDDREFKKGSFPGAINLPVGDVEKKMDSLPKGKPVVFVCPTGARSGEAYDTVKMLGGNVNAYFVDANIAFGSDGTQTVTERK